MFKPIQKDQHRKGNIWLEWNENENVSWEKSKRIVKAFEKVWGDWNTQTIKESWYNSFTRPLYLLYFLYRPPIATYIYVQFGNDTIRMQIIIISGRMFNGWKFSLSNVSISELGWGIFIFAVVRNEGTTHVISDKFTNKNRMIHVGPWIRHCVSKSCGSQHFLHLWFAYKFFGTYAS